MKKLILMTLVSVLVAATALAQEVKFDVAKSQLKWTGKKVTGEHWGYIKLKSGAVTLKGDKITSGKFVIDMTSITEEDLEAGEWHDKLLGHLKSDDFFSVAKHAESTLEITGTTATSGNEATLTGKLTIKGITQPISFKAVKTTSGYTANVVVDRTKYDIRYGSGQFFEGLGDKMIYDEFTLDVVLVK
jgi:polyisoprenoid-binding protein YceI